MRAHGLGAGLALLLSGCGVFGDGGPGQISSYVGAWEFFTGNQAQTCDDGTSPGMNLSGDALTIAQGSTSSELLVQQGICQVAFVIGAESAMLAREQTCQTASTDSNGQFTVSIRFTQSLLGYNNDRDLRFAQVDRRTRQYTGRSPVTCEVTTTGTLQKSNGRERGL
jgi:hypothetical protein